MPHHAQGFRCVAGDQNTLAVRKQMADKIADGVRLSSPRRALDKHSTMFFQLLCDSYLLRICGLAQEDVSVSLIAAAFWLVCF
jgi:hypothetical protein